MTGYLVVKPGGRWALPTDASLAYPSVDGLEQIFSWAELHSISSLTILPPSYKLNPCCSRRPHISQPEVLPEASSCSLSSQGNLSGLIKCVCCLLPGKGWGTGVWKQFSNSPNTVLPSLFFSLVHFLFEILPALFLPLQQFSPISALLCGFYFLCYCISAPICFLTTIILYNFWSANSTLSLLVLIFY